MAEPEEEVRDDEYPDPGAAITEPPKMTQEEFDALLIKYRDDFRHFASKVLKVQTTDFMIIPFDFNGPQRLLHEIIERIRAAGRPVRIIDLKARRQGHSTYFSARFYHKTSWNRNRYATQVTHEPEATDKLFKMVKWFHNFSPAWLRPATLYNNMKLLEFNRTDGKGLNSAFRVATAEKQDFGSGQLLHYVHLCMAPDTPVLVADGREKKIRDVVPGDSVITHNGSHAVVRSVFKKTAKDLSDKGEMVVIHPWLGSPITLTRQHKVWTNMGWVMAGDLDPRWHMVSMPIREITHGIRSLPIQGRKSKFGPAYNGPLEFVLNEETGFSIGYYLAEGCLVRTNKGAAANYHRIIFSLHQDEDAFALRACAPLAKFSKSAAKGKLRDGTLTKVYKIDSGVLADFIYKNFGCVDEKRIPDWVFDCGKDFCKGIVLGYLAGDGSKGIGGQHQNYESNSVTATSIRESLSYQIRDLVAALGYGWGSVKAKPGGILYGRNCRPAWVVHFNGDCGRTIRIGIGIPYAENGASADSGKRYRLDHNNHKVWLKIKKIRATRCDEAFDLEIDHEDHSFRTPHFSVSNSEVPKWPNPATTTSLLTSILMCVPPNNPETEVIFEATAKGIGGEFYDRFWGARYRIWIKRLDEQGRPVIEETINENAAESNNYTSIFLPWFVHEVNRKQWESNWGHPFKLIPSENPEECEVTIKKLYGLDDEQMYWRRDVLENLCNGSVDLFNQENPANPMHAFLGSGTPIFDNAKLLRLRDAAKPPAMRYECLTGLSQWLAKPMDGRLRVWKEPQRGRFYVIGGDVAEGLSHGDFSSADVVDHMTGEQVCQWHGKADPDQFGQILFHLGKRYNDAWIAVERNNHGLMTITFLVNMKYPHLYAEMVPEPPGKPRKRYGWVTTSATRPLILDNLIKEVRDDCHGIVCAETLEEMMAFKRQDNGRMEADAGQFDDRVLSLAIVKHIRQVTPIPRIGRPAHHKVPQKRAGGVKPGKIPPRAWT